MIGSYTVRVVRSWPGGPPRGSLIGEEYSKARREQLLKLGVVEKVEGEVPLRTTTVRTPSRKKKPRKSRLAARNG